jgi:hypothetical protein
VGTGLPLFGDGLPRPIGQVFIQMREFGLGTCATLVVWFTGLCILAFNKKQTAGSLTSPGPISPNPATFSNQELEARVVPRSDVAA